MGYWITLGVVLSVLFQSIKNISSYGKKDDEL